MFNVITDTNTNYDTSVLHETNGHHVDEANGHVAEVPAPIASPPRPPGPHGISMDPPFGRKTEGKLGPLSDAAQRDGQMLVTVLWVAHRSARRLGRFLKKHRPARCSRTQQPTCSACQHQPPCAACDLMETLHLLMGPAAAVKLGEAADKALAVLPWFDLCRRIDMFETAFAHGFRKDQLEKAPAPAKPS